MCVRQKKFKKKKKDYYGIYMVFICCVLRCLVVRLIDWSVRESPQGADNGGNPRISLLGITLWSAARPYITRSVSYWE